MKFKSRCLLVCLPILCALRPAQAATPLNDAALASVSGRDGIVMGAHLQLGQQPDSNTRVSLGFKVAGNTSYLMLDRVSGTLDLLGLEVRAVNGGASGSDVIQVTLPTFLGLKDFGLRGFAAQTDAGAPLANSLGQIQLNGSAQIQGQLLLWAK